MKNVRGGLSAITRGLLCKLQLMRDGVLVQGPTADDKLFLMFELKVFLTDESAMQSIWDIVAKRTAVPFYFFEFVLLCTQNTFCTVR